ncbi:MAG: glycosyltransferase [Enhydrobacter sp.]|nr:MAG: glycosyltransferase [Enhydrobacter sp.]
MATERPSTSSLAAPPTIAPLPEGDGRPFWSVMIPVYNAPEAYLRETLRSVLGQAPDVGQMQIEVVDNCSTEGDPEAVVREVGGDRVRFHRQPENLGMVENFNSCIRRATGRWVHILHGDDAVRPGFYAGLRVGIEVNPEVGAAACRIIYIDEDGHWTGLSELEARTRGVLDGAFATRQLIDQRLQFAGIVVRRSVYERVGGFLSLFVHCLDWDMWKRVALCTPIYYEPEPLACYRMHSGADSSRLYRTGANVVDERRSIDVTCSAFPSAEAKRLRRAARKAAGMRAARRARALWKIGHRLAAWRQAAEALRCSFAPAVVARTVYFVVRTIVR